MSDRLVCLCNFVAESEIKNALKKGASSTQHIQEYTRAGTNCGKCLPEIDRIVDDFLSEQPVNPQFKIDF
jgi:bacterioferritin-associated ferredoxin